jgi:hypothetical protein
MGAELDHLPAVGRIILKNIYINALLMYFQREKEFNPCRDSFDII